MKNNRGSCTNIIKSSLRKNIPAILMIAGFLLISSLISILIPLITRSMIDDGINKLDINVVISKALIIFICFLSGQFCAMMSTYFSKKMEISINNIMEKEYFIKLLNKPVDFFARYNISSITQEMNNDIGTFCSLMDANTFMSVFQIVRFIGGIISLCIISIPMTLATIIFIPIKYILTKTLSKLRRKQFAKLIEQSKMHDSWLGDTLSGILEIKVFNLLESKEIELDNIQKKLKDINIKSEITDSSNRITDMLLFQIITSMLYIIGTSLMIDSQITLGSLFAFISYTSFVLNPISSVLNLLYKFKTVKASTTRLKSFLETEESEYQINKIHNSIKTQRNIADISFRNVSFPYIARENILHQLSFTIKAKGKVAIFGANGSGKSTLISLMLQLHFPSTGEIHYGTQNIIDIPLQEKCMLHTYAPQKAHIFSGTIKENILLGDEYNYERMEKVLNLCQAQFVYDIENALDSHIGNDASFLSSGQRQKIALARALYKKAPIVILDEATSNFDSVSELSFFNSFDNPLINNRTIIYITHNTNCLQNADKVIFLHKGKIEGIDKHITLYEKNSLYRKALEDIATPNYN